MTVIAFSVRLVVMCSIYTQLNARAEMGTLQLGDPIFLNAQEATRPAVGGLGRPCPPGRHAVTALDSI